MKEVLVHRPGTEIEIIDPKSPEKYLFLSKPDLNKLQQEHNELIRMLSSVEMKIHYLGTNPLGKPNQYFVRDSAVIFEKKAVICRFAKSIRQGEEKVVEKRLKELGIEILHRICSPGILEGGNVVFIDEDTWAVGKGDRANEEGIRQLKKVSGKEIIPVPTDFHLDAYFNMVGENIALSYDNFLKSEKRREFLEFLKDKGIEIVFIPKTEEEKMVVNALQVGKNKIICGKNKLKEIFNDLGINIDVIEVCIEELRKGGGGVKCMVLELT